MYKKAISLMLAGAMTLSSLAVMNASADSAPVVTIGKDLSDEQKQTIMNFFNVDESKTILIEIDNQQERQYLEGLLPDADIGTHTISCSYILPTDDGGIIVKTANLTKVSDGMIANVLLTAGVENCQVICAAPYPVSGTGALTGVMTAYEQSGISLDEDRKALATEELVISTELVGQLDGKTAEIVDEDGNVIESRELTEADVLELLNQLKAEVVGNGLTKEEVTDIITEFFNERKIQLSEKTVEKFSDYLEKLSQNDKYKESFKEGLNNVTDKIKNGFDFNFTETTKEARGFFSKIWVAICNFFRGLFGGEKEDPDYVITTTEKENIFDDIVEDTEDEDSGITFDDTITGGDDTAAEDTEDENVEVSEVSQEDDEITLPAEESTAEEESPAVPEEESVGDTEDSTSNSEVESW